jgi:hypothetical protein
MQTPRRDSQVSTERILTTRELDLVGQRLGDLLVRMDAHFAAEWIDEILKGHATDDTVTQLFNGLTSFDDGGDLDAVEGLAVPPS